jgi:hypothetical protein
MFEGDDHFSFHDDLLRQERFRTPLEQKAPAPSGVRMADVGWAFCTRRSPQHPQYTRAKKVWAAARLLYKADLLGLAARRNADARRPGLSLSYPAPRE